MSRRPDAPDVVANWHHGSMTDDYLLYLEPMTGASMAEAGLLDMKLSEKSEVEAAAAAAAVGVWLVLNKRWAFTLCRRNGILTRARLHARACTDQQRLPLLPDNLP